MRRALLLSIAFIVVLVACQPSPQMIEEAIQLTETARPTKTSIPPTKTLAPTPTQEYCNYDEVMAARESLMPILDDFTGIFSSASSVTKVEQYLPLLNDLEDIQERYSKIDFPPCMENLDLYTAQSMTELHDSLELAQDANFDLAVQKLQSSQNYIIEATGEIENLTKCLPNCEP